MGDVSDLLRRSYPGSQPLADPPAIDLSGILVLRTLGVVALVAMLATAPAYGRGERDLRSEDKTAPENSGEHPSLAEEWYSLHYQFTGATQYHPSFAAKYTRQNSLSPEAESATAFVTTLYADLRLVAGRRAAFQPRDERRERAKQHAWSCCVPRRHRLPRRRSPLRRSTSHASR